MKSGSTYLALLAFLVLFTWNAHSQESMVGIDVGQVSDQYGTQSSVSSPQINANGKIAILKGNPKKGAPAIVAGGEIVVPGDTNSHAKEYAIFGGPEFHVFQNSFVFGFHVQIRKIIQPTAILNGQFFPRDTMELLEIPAYVRYNFGASKHAFIEAQGAPEFSPRFHIPAGGVLLPHPDLDHGYFVRGSVGYNFGHWYARATYQTRYFKFQSNPNNPNYLYNWRSNSITGGVGFSF
jgi:hypothetical protein